jgi:hypothetical protein
MIIRADLYPSRAADLIDIADPLSIVDSQIDRIALLGREALEMRAC